MSSQNLLLPTNRNNGQKHGMKQQKRKNNRNEKEQTKAPTGGCARLGVTPQRLHTKAGVSPSALLQKGRDVVRRGVEES